MNESSKHKLMAELAHALPMDRMLDTVIKAVEKYKGVQNSQTKAELQMYLMMLSTKMQIEEEGLDSILTIIDKVGTGIRIADRMDYGN